MTNELDKQIIIDGVDVSGCGYIDRDSAWCDLCMTNCAKETKPCYYKQLKAKEQECEELKKIINEAKNSKLDLKSFLVGEAMQNEYEQQLDQLKQNLVEIKEIANAIVNGTHFTDNIEEHFKELNKQILQKISEVVKE